jgi:hypothetical protein
MHEPAAAMDVALSRLRYRDRITADVASGVDSGCTLVSMNVHGVTRSDLEPT